MIKCVSWLETAFWSLSKALSKPLNELQNDTPNLLGSTVEKVMQVAGWVTCWCSVKIGETLQWVSNDQESNWNHIYSPGLSNYNIGTAFSSWLHVKMYLVDSHLTGDKFCPQAWPEDTALRTWTMKMTPSSTKTQINSVSCDPVMGM